MIYLLLGVATFLTILYRGYSKRHDSDFIATWNKLIESNPMLSPPMQALIVTGVMAFFAVLIVVAWPYYVFRMLFKKNEKR